MKKHSAVAIIRNGLNETKFITGQSASDFRKSDPDGAKRIAELIDNNFAQLVQELSKKPLKPARRRLGIF